MDLRGTQGADTLTGGAADDVIYGFGGNDTLKGGAGNDVIAGNEGNDVLQGGDGDDYLLGGPGNDTIDGGAGEDWAAYEDATAGVKVDLNITTSQNTGGGGIDKLTGVEHLYGSAFNDTLIGNAANNMMVGGEGHDSLSGGKGDDTLWGSAGNDTLDGGEGDDYLVGGAGDDIIKGGAGWDWSSYEDATAGVTVDLTKTTAQNTGGAGTDTLSGIEHLYGGKFADVLTGDAKDNYLWGGAGDDKLYGGAGDDHLSGGAGVNVIDGGDGWDTVDYAFSEVGVTINLLQDSPTSLVMPSGADSYISIEAVMGSAHDDVIKGNLAENYLFGDAGDDVIIAMNGGDTLDGGDGNDTFYGSSSLAYGAPDDVLLGGAGDDHFVLYGVINTTVDGGDGVDTLDLETGYNVTVDLNIFGRQQIMNGVYVELRGIENVVVGVGDNHLIGDEKDNVLQGGTYAPGQDIIDGGAGSDTVSYADARIGALNIDLNKSVQTNEDTGGRGTDTLISIENVIGTKNDDRITGDAHNNILEGRDGYDLLTGGAGRDTLIGGASADIFRFAAGDSVDLDNTGGNVDVITDFEAIDRLDFGAGSTPATYREMTASSYGQAQTLATSGVSSGANMKVYTAVQVGADVYVFVAGTTANSAGMENVVKLAGVGLNVIDATSFI